MMKDDIRDTPEYAAVAEHLRRLHEPAFGHPHALREPHVTGDGRHVVLTGMVFDELAGTPRTAIYTCQDGGLEPVSAPCGSARSARFSPDGSLLTFLSDRRRTGVFELWLLEATRFGEAVPVAMVPGTIEYAHWSPDGQQLLLGVAGLGAELAGGQGSGTTTADAAGDRPTWQPLVETGDDDGAWRGLWLYTLDTGEVSRLSPEGMNCWEAGWCGTGGVLTVASEDPSEDSWYQAALTLIDVHTAQTRELLRGEAQLALPSGSPDGKHAAVVQAVCSDRWVVAGDLTIIEVAATTATTVDTAGVDVTSLQWIDEGRIGCLGQRHMQSVAGIVDVPSGQIDEVFTTERACGGSWFYPDGAFTSDGRVVTIQES